MLLIAIEPMPKNAIKYPLQDDTNQKQSRKARGCCGVGVLPECFRALGCLTLSSILLGFGSFWLRWTNDGLTWLGKLRFFNVQELV